MTSPHGEHDATAQQLADALDQLQQVFDAIERTTDPQRAFELATQLVDDLGALYSQAADLRARQVGRIWEAEKMTLSVLAERINVRKARAGQLRQRALNLVADRGKEE